MKPNYREIDLTTWKRAIHCQVFQNSWQPQYGVSWELDITNFLAQVRSKSQSFTLSLIHTVAHCANQIEEFRYRFLEDRVVLYDRIDTSFTWLEPETELFKVVQVPTQDSLEAYLALAQKTIAEQKAYFTGPPENNVFQFSPFPWISFTHISHTYSGDSKQAVPIFDWGKYLERDSKIFLPFSVQVHHSFVDGIHLGKLAQDLQKQLDSYY